MFCSQFPEGSRKKRVKEERKSVGDKKRKGLISRGMDDGKADGVKVHDRNEACRVEGG